MNCIVKKCLSRTKGEVSGQDEYAVLIRMSRWEQFLKTELRPICEKWKCFPAHYLERLFGDPHYPGMHSWQCQCALCSGPGGIHYLAIDFPPALKDVQEKNMNSFQDRLPAFGGNLKGVLSQQRELAPSCLQTQTLLALIWCTTGLCSFQKELKANVECFCQGCKQCNKYLGISFNKKLISHGKLCIHLYMEPNFKIYPSFINQNLNLNLNRRSHIFSCNINTYFRDPAGALLLGEGNVVYISTH